MRATPEQGEHAVNKQPDAGGVSRRLLLRAGAVSMAALFAKRVDARGLGGARKAISPPPRPAVQIDPGRQWIRQHPRQDIPGIDSVRVSVDHPHPQKVIRYINQLHMDVGMTKEDERRVIECQLQIVKAILHLRESSRTNVRYIINEGQRYGEDFRDYAARFGFDIKNAIDTDEEVGRWGSAETLYRNHDAELIGAEHAEITRKMQQAKATNRPLTECYDIQFHQRNWHILQVANEQRAQVMDLILGMDHDMQDTILRWNQMYPHQAFSLIELIPHTIAKTWAVQGMPAPDPNVAGKRIYIKHEAPLNVRISIQ